jgi:polyhydroxyalkanoate synthesis regulator phasin
MQKLQEQIEILKEDNKVIRHSFWVSSQENRALLGEIARLEGLVKLKDNVIDTWLKRGKVWDEERAKFIGNARDVSRQFGEETQKYENQSSRMEKSRTLSSKHDSSDSEMEVSTLVWGSPLRTSRLN